jgi:hypothetical protein
MLDEGEWGLMTETLDVSKLFPTAPVVLAPPSSCGNEMEQLDWAGPITVSLGELLVGVRTTSTTLTELLAAALGSHVRSQPEAPAYYSLKLGTPSRRRQTPMHYLYVGSRVVFGSRDIKRVVDALLARLSIHAFAPPAPYLCLRGVPVAFEDKVVLAPPELLAFPLQVERALLPRGVAVGTHEYVAVGGDGSLQPPHTLLDLREEHTAAAQLEQVAALSPEPPLPAAPWRPATWLIETADEASGELEPAQALLYGVRQLRLPLPTTAQQALEDVAAVTEVATVRRVSWQTPDELCELVATEVAA